MRDYRQIVLQRLFKGFRFNRETKRIEACFQHDVPSKLVQIGVDECGYEREQAVNFIQQTVDSITDVLDFSCVCGGSFCRISDLSTYSLVRIRHEGISITMFYLEDCKFLLLKDEGNTLRSGDLLRCLSYTLEVGRDVCFSVSREGNYYPDESHVMKISHIDAIEQFSPPYLELPTVDTRINHSVVNAMSTVRAWQPTNSGRDYWFMPQDFTTDVNAMFNISLEKMEFSLNPDFDQSLYNSENTNYIQTLKMVCDYKEEADVDKRRKTLINGKLVPVFVNGNQYALRVQSNAQITL